MFLVRHIKTGKIFKVYAISGTHFLFYIWDDQPHWEYGDINLFEPVEGVIQ